MTYGKRRTITERMGNTVRLVQAEPGGRWEVRVDCDGIILSIDLSTAEAATASVRARRVESFVREATREDVEALSVRLRNGWLDFEAPLAADAPAFTLRRSATIPNPWLVRFKNESGQLVEHSTGEVDRATAERVAEKIHRRAREMERVESERISSRVARGEDVTAGSVLREHVAERPAPKPVWWANGKGAGEWVPAFEVKRGDHGVEISRTVGGTTFVTAPHRVTDDKKWETVPDDRPRHHEGAILSPSTHEDTNLISQGGGWSTFKREGEWWCERSRGSGIGLGRVEFTLSTRDDGVSGERFFHLQNEFRDTPLNELLLKTYALRAGWARAGRVTEIIARVVEDNSELLGALAESERREDTAPRVYVGSEAEAKIQEVAEGKELERNGRRCKVVYEGPGTWLGKPIESGVSCGDLRLRPALGGRWSLILEGLYREPGDRDTVVLEGSRDEIDALTRAWIKSIATLVPTLTIVSTIEASGGYEATLSDGTILKSPDGVAWRRSE